MFACKLGHLEVVKMLVGAGADLAAANNEVIRVQGLGRSRSCIQAFKFQKIYEYD